MIRLRIRILHFRLHRRLHGAFREICRKLLSIYAIHHIISWSSEHYVMNHRVLGEISSKVGERIRNAHGGAYRYTYQFFLSFFYTLLLLSIARVYVYVLSRCI